MKAKLNIFTIFTLILPLIAKESMTNPFKRKLFTTKTSYNNSIPSFIEFLKTNPLNEHAGIKFNSEKNIPKCCEPVQLSWTLRHGSRYPSLKDIIGCDITFNKIKLYLQHHKDDQLSQNLFHWTNNFTVEQAQELHPVGAEEHYEIGRRVGKTYQSLWRTADNKDIVFESSSKSRSFDSAHNFIQGLKHTSEFNHSNVVIDNTLTRFFDGCKKFAKTEKSDKILSEFHKFKNGKYMSEALERLNARLGVTDPSLLDTGDVKNVYTTCGFETGLLGLDSGWCYLLEDRDLEVVEYLMELKHYWVTSYGYELGYSISCPILSSIFNGFDEAIQAIQTGNRYTKAVFRFGHAETIMPFLCLLGLFKDPLPLSAENFAQHNNRQFRTSLMAPMAANIGLNLYRCQCNGQENVEDYMVELVVNEQKLRFPGCEDYLCPYSFIKDLYKKIQSNCNFDEMCELDGDQKDEL
ncbi:unnamed protein product [Owenia fusiformis]|uniref:Multiple inositol polyphosphate phosphatase 1 n=1 Tax=Owenia fusiformis TaxID=6347 RepID=A0A8J1T4Y1_OWEFU|nr:unnamed protein product [Owenia fusiformis]